MDILSWPDDRLSAVCAEVTEITPEVRDLAAQMLKAMYAAKGRGLAAPQVGVMQRLFVMDAGWKEGSPTPQVFVNPVVTALPGADVIQTEGCLSLRGVLADVTRPGAVSVTWTDLDGRARQAEFDGFEAACIQHEVDHLDGVLIFDRLEQAERDAFLAAYEAA